MRKMETSSVRWEDVDLKLRIIILQDIKNHKTHILPISDFIYGLMESEAEIKKICISS